MSPGAAPARRCSRGRQGQLPGNARRGPRCSPRWEESTRAPGREPRSPRLSPGDLPSCSLRLCLKSVIYRQSLFEK